MVIEVAAAQKEVYEKIHIDLKKKNIDVLKPLEEKILKIQKSTHTFSKFRLSLPATLLEKSDVVPSTEYWDYCLYQIMMYGTDVDGNYLVACQINQS